MAQSGTSTGVSRFALAMDMMGSVAIKTMTRCGGPLGEVDSGRVGREMGKTADIRATGAFLFFDVDAVVLATGLSEVTDLIVVGLPFIPVSIASIN